MKVIENIFYIVTCRLWRAAYLQNIIVVFIKKNYIILKHKQLKHQIGTT